jgi:hypothetical protein
MVVPLVVLLEIDAAGLAIFEFERDAPRSIDMDRVAFRVESLQRMKIETRDVHFLGPDGDIETVQSCENALMHLRIDLRTPALGPEVKEGLALEEFGSHPSVSN